MLRKIKLLGGSDPILSTNIPLRNDDMPYATYKEPQDQGVAVYFTVLKYLGLESAQPESFLGKAITVLPAALLVGAAAVSLWACQPLLAAVPMEDFDASRARYLRSRMRRANVAAALLLAATLVSVGVWTMLVFR